MTTYTENSFACAINKLVSELIGDLKIDIGIDPNSEGLEASAKNEIYLIVREAVTNIKLHSGAERAEIKLEMNKKGIHLFVQDDGRGFSLRNITKKPEGLIKIKESIKVLGGSYEMEASRETNGGVVHWIHIPLPIVSGEQYRETIDLSLTKVSDVWLIKGWREMKNIRRR